MKRAALIGINASPLKGCLNDALDWEGFLFYEAAFGEVRLLIDANATKEAILQLAWWLRAGVKAGDELVFAMSSHGTRARTSNGVEDCLVPVDYDGLDVRTLISATELAEVWSGLPEGVKLTVILDACHTGNLRDYTASLAPVRGPQEARFIAPPLQARPGFAGAARGFGHWLRVEQTMEHMLLAACQSDGTAADSTFGMDGRPNGAFTRKLIDSIRLGPARTWLQVIEDVHRLLDEDGFAQEPQLVAPAKLINSYPFNGRMS